MRFSPFSCHRILSISSQIWRQKTYYNIRFGYVMRFQHFPYFPFSHILLYPNFIVNNRKVHGTIMYKFISFPTNRNNFILVAFLYFVLLYAKKGNFTEKTKFLFFVSSIPSLQVFKSRMPPAKSLYINIFNFSICPCWCRLSTKTPTRAQKIR